MSPAGRAGVEVERAGEVLRHARALLVEEREIGLGIGEALLRCLRVPFGGARKILRDAETVVVHQREIELVRRCALLGRAPIPGERLAVILRHAEAGGIERAERVLRAGVALLGRFAVPDRRGRMIERDAERPAATVPRARARRECRQRARRVRRRQAPARVRSGSAAVSLLVRLTRGPFARKPLRLGDLLGGHQLGEHVARLRRLGVAFGGREVHPLVRLT